MEQYHTRFVNHCREKQNGSRPIRSCGGSRHSRLGINRYGIWTTTTLYDVLGSLLLYEKNEVIIDGELQAHSKTNTTTKPLVVGMAASLYGLEGSFRVPYLGQMARHKQKERSLRLDGQTGPARVHLRMC